MPPWHVVHLSLSQTPTFRTRWSAASDPASDIHLVLSLRCSKQGIGITNIFKTGPDWVCLNFKAFKSQESIIFPYQSHRRFSVPSNLAQKKNKYNSLFGSRQEFSFAREKSKTGQDLSSQQGDKTFAGTSICCLQNTSRVAQENIRAP